MREATHAALAEHFERSYAVYYNKNTLSLLNALCDKYGSDKGEIRTSGHPYPWQSHTYADFMERMFGHCRASIRHVFECGIGTNNTGLASNMSAGGKPGASLRVWQEYFPEAQIVGADIDRDILFQEQRIKTYHCDQTDVASIRALWATVEVDQFDLMIDDGLHTFSAGVCLLENSFHKLREGGVYIIEDVLLPSLVEFRSYLATRELNYELVSLYRDGLSLHDNALVVIRK